MPGAAVQNQPEKDRLGWSDLVDEGPGEAPLDLDTPVMPAADGEALGERIAAAIFAKFGADWVTVSVRKPKPISGVLEHAGIRITREREK